MADVPTMEEFRSLLTAYWCNACDQGNVAARQEFARPGSLQREALGSRGDSLERRSIEQEAKLLAMYRTALEATHDPR